MRVKSSNIYSIDWKNNSLEVTFKDKESPGETYRYFGVPESIYKELIHAQSVGSYFNTWVKQVGYRYENLGKLKGKPTREEVDEITTQEINTLVNFLEEKGLVRRELDESGTERIVMAGDIAMEVVKSFVALPENIKKKPTLIKELVEMIVRQNLDPLPKALKEYVRKKK